jgi:hypothetical protein
MILLFAVVTGPLLAFNIVLATRTATYRLRRPLAGSVGPGTVDRDPRQKPGIRTRRPLKLSVRGEGFRDPALGDVVLAFEAFRIDTEQDLDAVPGPFGDLGCCDAAVEPG